MTAELHQVPGMIVYPSQANFVLVKLPPGADGGLLRDYLLSQHGVLVRECGNKLGITSQFVRLVVRPRADVQRLLTGLYGYLGIRMDNPLEAALPGSYPPIEAGLPSGYPQVSSGYPAMTSGYPEVTSGYPAAASSNYPAASSEYVRRDEFTQPVPIEGAWVAEALRSQRTPAELLAERPR
jgi:hypothetical protein